MHAALTIDVAQSEGGMSDAAGRENPNRLVRELDDAKRLEESTGHIAADTVELLERSIDTAMALMRSDFATIYELDAERGELTLIASRNFQASATGRWTVVPLERAVVEASALRRGERVIVPNVHTAGELRDTESVRAYALSGIIAVQSTPLSTRDGRVLGVMSTHWRAAHSPDPRLLDLLDILSRQIADFLDRRRAEDAIHTNETRMRGLKETFQAAISGDSFEHSLHRLGRIVTEELSDGARMAFYIADPDGTRLRTVRSATDMPNAYSDEVDRAAIGPRSLACGLASSAGKPILTKDVFYEPLWEGCRHLAREHDFRGCWSFPIEATDGRWIGTLALYFRDARTPTSSDLALVDTVTRAAAIVMTRHSDARERTRVDTAFRHAQSEALEEVERRVSQRTAERDELSRRLFGAEEAERKRLSRELHDQLGQELTAFRLGVDDAARLLRTNDGTPRVNDKQLLERIEQLQELAERLMRGARYVALELRPPEIDDVGLESALDSYLREWSGRYGVRTELTVSSLDGTHPVSGEVALVLYRIAQEALMNVAKHARATHVSVIVDRPNSDVRLIVEDDGIGFDVAEPGHRAPRDRRFGIRGMRERAALIGGTLEVESSCHNGGTTVYVRVPLVHDAHTGEYRA